MSRPIVYGHPEHVHVRAVLFALAEKDVVYRVQPREQWPLLRAQEAANYKFGEPILDASGQIVHGAETTLRFVADAFAGPALQPTDAFARARMNRALELCYREAGVTLGSRIIGPYIVALMAGEWLDPKASSAIITDARKTVTEFELILKDDPFLAGPVISLADIALSSLLDHVMDTPDRDLIVPEDSSVRVWWERVSQRKAFQMTKPKGGALSAFFSSGIGDQPTAPA